MSAKRKTDESSDCCTSKKLKVSSTNGEVKEVAPFNLLDFSDDVLVIILGMISRTNDLINIANSCTRLANVCLEKSIWQRVCYESPFSTREFRKMLTYLNEKTEKVSITGHIKSSAEAGRPAKKDPLTPSTLNLLVKNCPNLRHFELKECFVDTEQIKLEMLPPNIHQISLRDSEFVHITDKVPYFRDMHLKMPHLTAMDFSGCKWLTNHALMAMCKCENLEELYLRGCLRMGECYAYTAIACRFGFQKLRKLDIRDTSAGNTEIACFGRLPMLTHFYLGYTTSRTGGISRGGNKIGDRGLMSIQNHGNNDPHVSKLVSLSITHTDATNTKMFGLAKELKKLKELDLTGTRVTKEGVETIRTILPECEIEFDPTQCQLKENGEPYQGEEDEVYFFVAPNN